MIAPLLFGLTGAGFLFRGLRRPVRALVVEGEVRRCEGVNSFGICDPTLEVLTKANAAVFSVGRGRVVAKGSDYLHLLLLDEMTILFYEGVNSGVAVGSVVQVGEKLGTTQGNVVFGVTEFLPDKVVLVAPSAWLLSRGLRIAQKVSGAGWCAQKDIRIPSAAQTACRFWMPETKLSLLPVRIETGS